MQNDLAATVAERCIDYYYNKIQEENERKYNRIQKRRELRKKKYKTWLSIGVLLVMIALCMSLVFMEMQVRNQSLQVARLQSELNSITNENADAKKRLIDSADYQWVEQEAKKLGMTYPSPDKVVYYDAPTEDFMIQTQEIPEK